MDDLQNLKKKKVRKYNKWKGFNKQSVGGKCEKIYMWGWGINGMVG